ncbi:hypothetical protein ACQVP2_30535 [Methylobacterium aquaticum]|uniref:hypothetical protein n=1 Tax=Methylobacterium aquaticum TaxID=270351 RepID=UPI003D16A3BB
MRTFRLHRGWRDRKGPTTDHAASGRTIKAANAPAAAEALVEDDFMPTDKINFVWFTDQHGVVLWSLRLDDEHIA